MLTQFLLLFFFFFFTFIFQVLLLIQINSMCVLFRCSLWPTLFNLYSFNSGRSFSPSFNNSWIITTWAVIRLVLCTFTKLLKQQNKKRNKIKCLCQDWFSCSVHCCSCNILHFRLIKGLQVLRLVTCRMWLLPIL